MRLHRLALVAGLVVSACQGTVTLPDSQPDDGPVSDFRCREAPAPEPALRRLSRVQHRNTVVSVLGRFYDAGTVDAIVGAIQPRLDARPADLLLPRPGDEAGQRLFARSDQSISDDLVRADLSVAQGLGAELTASSERITAWAGSCATDGDVSNDGACLDTLVDSLGLLTHRRPLTAEERAFYRDEVYIDGDVVDTEGLAELVTVMFAQPAFVFHLEGTGALTAYEAASRLSYHFWNDMPDEPLLAAAADGSLLTDDGWRAEVTRVASDPRGQRSVRELLVQWLKFDRVAPLSSGTGGAFEDLRGDLVLDRTTDQALIDEVVDVFQHVLVSGGTFRDFFLSDITLNQNPQLAALYDMAPSPDGSPVPVPAERVGILTRAGMLLARSEMTPPSPGPRTHPILRGAFIKRQILCARIDVPPPTAMQNLPEIDQTVMTSRQGTELLTEGSGSCRGCHAQLNPPGYAFEQYDSLGRFRAEERLFHPDGTFVRTAPVDPLADLPELDRPVQGAVELSEALYETELPGACFVRHYARFALGRTEDVNGADSCILREMDEAIDADRPLVEVLSLIVLDPRFRVRTVE